MKRILALLMLLSVAFCLCACGDTEEQPKQEAPVIYESWDEELLNSDPEDVEYEYSFNTVEDLLSAIKREPNKYNNVKIKVVGTVRKYATTVDETVDDIILETRTQLLDFTADTTNLPIIEDRVSADGVLSRYNFDKKLQSSKSKIEIKITNNAQFFVVESGDLVKLYGTLTITRTDIYIDNCEYALVATLDERKQNIENQ